MQSEELLPSMCLAAGRDRAMIGRRSRRRLKHVRSGTDDSPRRMRRLSAIIVGVCAAGAVAGCGTAPIDPAKVANLMRQLLESQFALHVRSVRCPATINASTGAVTYCTATLTDGNTVRMTATATGGSGQIRVAPAEMIADRVQSFIERALAHRGIRATASCPQHVPIVVGRTFLCLVSERRGRRAKFLVTIKPGGAFTTSSVR
jgi:Domain of unknown function (DUF4333)